MSSESTTNVDWPQLGQTRFDQLAEALVHRKHGSSATVTAVNGRGGDGGKDTVVRIRQYLLPRPISGRFCLTAAPGSMTAEPMSLD